MKKYHFPLATVRRVRKVEEDRASMALAEAERIRVAAEDLAAHREAKHRTVRPIDGVATAAAFLAARERQERSASMVREAKQEVDQARMAIIARRAALASAVAARTAVDNLDERRRAEHALELQREETIEIDDLVTGRRRRSEP